MHYWGGEYGMGFGFGGVFMIVFWIIVTEKFPGWKDFRGMIEHMKFVQNYHREIAKVALVSDSKIADFAEAMGKHFVKTSIKHFPFKEVESARRLISQV